LERGDEGAGGRSIPLDIAGPLSIIVIDQSQPDLPPARVIPGSRQQDRTAGEGAFMKKIVMVHELYALLWLDTTFLNREDIRVFVASTNDEALTIHQAEHMDLIVTKFDLPGLPTEEFCSLVRDSQALRTVSLIVTCTDNPDSIRASSRCRANAVLLEPVYPDMLVAKAQQLLSVAERERLRVLLSAQVESRTDSESFPCRTLNVSVSGMLVETERLLAVGTSLACQFSLPNAKKIKAACRIVRSLELTAGEGYQYGLIFADISDSDRQAVDEYVREMSGKSSRQV
jgi:DNA-binding response OmpR family regulator